jgi:hypothetical protein
MNIHEQLLDRNNRELAPISIDLTYNEYTYLLKKIAQYDNLLKQNTELLIKIKELENENSNLKQKLDNYISSHELNNNSYMSWVAKKIIPNPSYWKPDKECINCDGCSIKLDAIHHCRECGLGFCNTCSNFRKIVKSKGYSDMQRVCKKCYTQNDT